MYIYSKITLLVLLLTLFIQYKRYGIKALLHPSFSFLAVWILSVLSFELFLMLGAELLIIREEYLNELFIFISFTSLCFILAGWKSYNRIKNKGIRLRLFIPYNVFKYFSLIFLINALISMMLTGLNIVEARMINVENALNFYVSGGKLSIWQIVMNLFFGLNFIFTIYSGWILGKYSDLKTGKKIIFLLPLSSTVLATIASGGRSSIISAISLFVVGFLLAVFTSRFNSKEKIKTLLKYTLIAFLFYSFYTTYVSQARLKYNAVNSYFLSILEKEPIYIPFGGLLEYLVFHYQGYQLRMVDTFNPRLEYGQNTFSFITHYNLPVISQLLKREISIRSLFNLKDTNVLKANIEAQNSNLPSIGITATIYIILKQDFGFWGTLFITLLFVILTQKIFERLFLKNNTGFFSIIIFLAISRLWLVTIFSHHLSGTWFNMYLYPVLLVEIINLIFRHKHSHKLSTDNDLFFKNNNTVVEN